MSEQQTSAVSSPAEVEDVFRGEQPSLAEFSHYRQSGELPARFKPTEEAESEPADAPEETVETEGDEPESEPESEPEESQEQPKHSSAEKRIKQLLAEKKELQRKLEASAKPDGKSDSSSAQAAPQQQYTRPKPTAEDRDQNGNPKYSTYEDFVEELADWKAEQRLVQSQREQSAREQSRELQSKVDEARTRYEDFDDVIQPALSAVMGDQKISPTVKAMLNDSEVLPDLLYTLGSADDLAKLAKLPPGKQVRYIAALESGIVEELSNSGKEERAPEAKKTSAPKPPSPVSGASSRAFDVSDESLSPEEWARKRSAQIEKRKKG